jgi:hypothetical protein
MQIMNGKKLSGGGAGRVQISLRALAPMMQPMGGGIYTPTFAAAATSK